MRALARLALALAAASAAGCVATEPAGDGPRLRAVFGVGADGLAVTNAAPSAGGEAGADAPHAGPWGWEELAVRAGLRADGARVELLAAAAGRLKAGRELEWKSPEVRLGYDLASSGGSESRPLKLPDPLDSRQSNGRESGFSAGVRLYVPNPFVNRYLRGRADARAASSEARAAVEAYAVYSEVKMLCCEATRAGLELACAESQARACEELRRTCAERMESGVFASPLDAVRAEAKAVRLRLECGRLRAERAALVRRIAFFADVPAGELEAGLAAPALPDAAGLSAERLAEVAFARRPDLAEAVAELAAADADVGAAKAACVPWLRFVEASYAHGGDWEDSYGRHAADHEDGFGLKVSLLLPVFTWTGGTVSLAKAVRGLADARLSALRESIRREVAGALEDYRQASEPVPEIGEAEARMERLVEEYASSSRARAEETCRARAELEDYRKVRVRAEMLRAEAALRLESVVGGPIAGLAAEGAENGDGDEVADGNAVKSGATPAE